MHVMTGSTNRPVNSSSGSSCWQSQRSCLQEDILCSVMAVDSEWLRACVYMYICKYLIYVVCCFNYSRIAVLFTLYGCECTCSYSLYEWSWMQQQRRMLSGNCVCDAGFTGTNCACKDEVEHLLSHICDDCMLFYTDICFQRNTSNCDLALMVAACRALEVTLSSGSSLPQSCLTT